MIDFDNEELETIWQGMNALKKSLPDTDPVWKEAGRVQRMIKREREDPRVFTLPPIAVDLVNRVSGIASIVGDVTAIGGDARIMAWAGKSDYWLWLVLDDEKQFRVLIDVEEAPDDKLYNIVGYCNFHNIQHEFAGEDHRDELGVIGRDYDA